MSGNILPTYRQIKPAQPLRPLTTRAKPAQAFTGQRTMPLPGAPLLPQNPFLSIMRMMQRYGK
ncbi:MAG: hypothetical protein ABSG70_18455 [Terriglobales bacterium]|jgi:hypothetical protein